MQSQETSHLRSSSHDETHNQDNSFSGQLTSESDSLHPPSPELGSLYGTDPNDRYHKHEDSDMGQGEDGKRLSSEIEEEEGGQDTDDKDDYVPHVIDLTPPDFSEISQKISHLQLQPHDVNNEQLRKFLIAHPHWEKDFQKNRTNVWTYLKNIALTSFFLKNIKKIKENLDHGKGQDKMPQWCAIHPPTMIREHASKPVNKPSVDKARLIMENWVEYEHHFYKASLPLFIELQEERLKEFGLGLSELIKKIAEESYKKINTSSSNSKVEQGLFSSLLDSLDTSSSLSSNPTNSSSYSNPNSPVNTSIDKQTWTKGVTEMIKKFNNRVEEAMITMATLKDNKVNPKPQTHPLKTSHETIRDVINSSCHTLVRNYLKLAVNDLITFTNTNIKQTLTQTQANKYTGEPKAQEQPPTLPPTKPTTVTTNPTAFTSGSTNAESIPPSTSLTSAPNPSLNPSPSQQSAQTNAVTNVNTLQLPSHPNTMPAPTPTSSYQQPIVYVYPTSNSFSNPNQPFSTNQPFYSNYNNSYEGGYSNRGGGRGRGMKRGRGGGMRGGRFSPIMMPLNGLHQLPNSQLSTSFQQPIQQHPQQFQQTSHNHPYQQQMYQQFPANYQQQSQQQNQTN